MLRTRSRSPKTVAARIPHRSLLVLFDIVAVATAIVLAFALRFDTDQLDATVRQFLPAALLPIAIQPLVNSVFGLYRREWRYAGIRELVAISLAVLLGAAISSVGLALLGIAHARGTAGMPRSLVPLEALISLALIGGARFAVRLWAEMSQSALGREAGPSLVYGAGEAGAAIARIAQRDTSLGVKVVGFLDDDRAKRGSRILGHRILGGITDLPEIARRTSATQLVIAMPSAPGAVIRTAVDSAIAADMTVRIVPPLLELLQAPGRSGRLRPVSVDDLLRRAPVSMDLDELVQYVNGASVMVTGAGGSIGGELAQQISRLGPRRLVLVENNESSLWRIDREIRSGGSFESGLVPLIADLRSRRAIERVVAQHQPDIVLHAAALKHVPICELQPTEAVLTNVVGTWNLLEACAEHAVPRYVQISTDKAVHPVGVMGATKRFAEMLTIEAAHASQRRYMVVRFGNVLGSSGSVVPIFQRQLELGLPITITHPDTTRYFMTIPEAASLTLQAATTAGIGEIYVLDMGEPVRIVDLAEDMIRLSAADPTMVEIQYIGLRPGERLEERLFQDHENTERTQHERVWRVISDPGTSPTVASSRVPELERLALSGDERGVRAVLAEVGALQVGSAVAVG